MLMSNIGTPNTDEIWKSPPPDYSEVFSNDNEVKKSGRKSIELVVCTICMDGSRGMGSGSGPQPRRKSQVL